jgi:hypothetical protein
VKPRVLRRAFAARRDARESTSTAHYSSRQQLGSACLGAQAGSVAPAEDAMRCFHRPSRTRARGTRPGTRSADQTTNRSISLLVLLRGAPRHLFSQASLASLVAIGAFSIDNPLRLPADGLLAASNQTALVMGLRSAHFIRPALQSTTTKVHLEWPIRRDTLSRSANRPLHLSFASLPTRARSSNVARSPVSPCTAKLRVPCFDIFACGSGPCWMYATRREHLNQPAHQ